MVSQTKRSIKQRALPFQNRQQHKRPEHLLGSNTKCCQLCINDLPQTRMGKLIGPASCRINTPLLGRFFGTLRKRLGGWEVALSIIEAGPACSKPLVGVGMRMFTGKRRSFGASARSTRASPLHFVGAERPADSLALEMVRLS